LGITYIEFSILSTLDRLHPDLTAIRIEAGGLIRRLRFWRGITQAALASITGIHRTYLSRAERGQVMPSIVTLMRIAGALGVDKISMRLRSSSNYSRRI
jgi:transcriptional regulator with XRE-family HTH domain